MICTNHVDIADGVRRCYRCGRPYCGNCLMSLQGQFMAVHVLALADYIPALVTKEKTCLHDLLANTRVVSVD